MWPKEKQVTQQNDPRKQEDKYPSGSCSISSTDRWTYSKWVFLLRKKTRREERKTSSSSLRGLNTTKQLPTTAAQASADHILSSTSAAHSGAATWPLRLRAFRPRARATQISVGRERKKPLMYYGTGSGGARNARARGSVSWKHRPGVFTRARPRADPVVQSARTWRMEVDVEPALNVGQGLDC